MDRVRSHTPSTWPPRSSSWRGAGYVIGTLSSNIGRLVHELQGNRHRFHDLDGLPAWFLAGDGVVENNVRGCVWQHGCSNHQMTPVLALSSGEEHGIATPSSRRRAMAWRTTR